MINLAGISAISAALMLILSTERSVRTFQRRGTDGDEIEIAHRWAI